MLIYKILRAPEWAELDAAGKTRGAPVDLADGFIHFSTADQVAETARRHFAGAQGLVLAAVDTDRLGDALTWEPSRGGANFPHLYAMLARAAVVWTQPMPLVDGAHVLPDDLASNPDGNPASNPASNSNGDPDSDPDGNSDGAQP